MCPVALSHSPAGAAFPEVFLKRVLIALAAVLVLIIALILVVPSFVDWNQYRDEIANQIEDATGRRVSIDGEVSFGVLPSPALSIADMRIANLPGATSVDLVTLGSLDVEVALFPLLTGTVQVERIVLVDAVIDLEVLPDGRQNWVFADETPAADTAETSGSSIDVSVDRFLISNGTVLYRSGGEAQRLDGLDLEISAKSLSGPFEIEGDLDLNKVPYALKANIGRLDNQRTPLRANLTADTGGLVGAFSGSAALQAAAPDIEGKLDLTVADPAALMAAMADGEQPSGFLQDELKIAAEVSGSADRVSLDAMTLSLGALSGKGGASIEFGEQPDLKLLLNVSSLDLDSLLGEAYQDVSEPSSGDDAQQGFDVPDGINGTAEVTVDAMTYMGGNVRQVRIIASVEDGRLTIGSASALLPGGSDLAFSGATGSGDGPVELTGRLRLASSSARALLGWAGLDLQSVPADRLGQLSLDSGVTISPALVQLQGMNLVLDTSTVTGAFAYALQDRPSFSADLSMDRLNLDAYLSDGPVEEEVDLAESLSVLDSFDTRVRLSVDRLTYNRTPVSGVTAELDLVDGALALKQLAAQDFGGTAISATGTGEAFSADPVLDLSVTTRGPRAGSLLDVFGIGTLAGGAADEALDLEASLSGTLASTRLSVTGGLGDTALTLSGDSTDLMKDSRSVNLRIDLQNPSWAAFARQIDLADLAPVDGSDSPATLKGTVVSQAGTYDANLEVQLAGAAVAGSGQVVVAEAGVTYDLQVDARGTSLPALVRGLGVDYSPANDDVAFEVSSKVTGGEALLNAEELTARLGAATIAGEFAVDMSGKRPRVMARFTTEKFDADPFLEPVDTGPQQVRQRGGQRWSSEPIGLDFLKSFDGELSLEARELRFRRYVFDEPKLSIDLNEGVLQLKTLSGFLFGGAASFSGFLDVSSVPVFTIDIDLNDASVAQALQTTADLQSATGTFQMNAKFAGQGDSEMAIVSSLRGRGTLEARDGVIRGFDLSRLGEQMLSLVSYDDFIGLADAAFDGGETPYRLISAPLTMTNGIAVIENGRAELTNAEGSLIADVNLPLWQMDAHMEVRFSGADYAGIPPAGLRIYGDIDAPRQERRIRELTSYIGSRLAKRVLEDVLGQSEDGGSGLEQLLGGGPGDQDGDGGPPQPNPMEQLFRGIMDQVRQGRQ